MTSFNDYAKPQCLSTKNRCLSDYLYTSTNSISSSNFYSRYNFQKGGYIDQNLGYLNFASLQESIKSRAAQLGIGYEENVNNPVFNYAGKQVKVLSALNPNLIINPSTQCNTATIYLVPGNLTINPDFTIPIANNKNLGCMFIVGGNLTINGGNIKGSATGAYDLINAFILLTSSNNNSIIIPPDNYEKLRIVGGIVGRNTNMINTILRKSFGKVTLPVDMEASEEIVYEGGRYISLFGDVFVNQNVLYNINELPYINTL
jgi:hypothetical protein